MRLAFITDDDTETAANGSGLNDGPATVSLMTEN